MDRWLPQSALVFLPVAVVRLLLASLLVAILLIAAPQADALPAVLAASGGYVALVVVTALAGRGRRPRVTRTLRLIGLIADIAVISIAVALHDEAQPPLWPLYVAPIAIALPAGPAVTRAFAVLSVAALAATLALTGIGAADVAWAAIIVATLGAALSLLAARDDTSAARDEEWRAAGLVGRRLARDLDRATTAAAVVDAARSLVRTHTAGVWWWDAGTDAVQLGAWSGDSLRPAADLFAPALLAQLRRQPDRASLIAGSDGSVVLVQPLVSADGPLAILTVGPAPAPVFRGALRDRLAALAPWAGEVLARTRDYERVRAAHTRETALRAAAAEFAATATHRGALEALLRAAGPQLDARAAVVARASGELLIGDADWAAGFGEHGVGTVRRLETGILLAVDRSEAGLAPEERAWLDELGRLADPALRRGATQDQLVEQLALLTDALDQLPAPALIYSPERRILRMNAAFRALRVAPPAFEPDDGPGELTLGDPPRCFVVETAGLPGKHVLRLLREITRERQALRAKEELIAMMGHELRTPLTSVQGYSRMMVRHLDVVREQVERLDHMIGSFVDASRTDGAPSTAHHEPLDPAELAHEAADGFRGAHEDRELALVIGPALPVLGDRGALAQVFDNLLDNAAKYSPPGGRIELIVEGHEDRTRFAVRDSGDGIEPQDLQRIFERSYRVSSARTAQGQGLGLSIVRDVLAAHSGTIWAESDGLSRGSTFWFELPVAGEDETPGNVDTSAGTDHGAL